MLFFTYGVSNIVMSIPLYLCLLDTCPAEILELDFIYFLSKFQLQILDILYGRNAYFSCKLPFQNDCQLFKTLSKISVF